ncbi:hypothetical protein [Cupriavidus numazuensis]|uniref:Uncharacterized protein n=1 Tax=Cupriavidus numazuensis TaxID=221992 RepID=A0ABN7PSX5_9BURK|nr:hypothetical protein [Cupriavidus numazuensis]CAG2136149.1 hypothetical protein LMG26411_01202 [Cupriavidus numazuensis]
MIQFVLAQGAEPNTVELRTSSVGSDTAAKPPLVVHHDHLQSTLLCLLRASCAKAPEINS